jgi:curved DNA-binding protein CbpA
VHDLFDILGLPVNAPASEVRRVCARRPRRLHPDFGGREPRVLPRASGSAASRDSNEIDRDLVAIDFVRVADLVDRIQATFFGNAR